MKAIAFSKLGEVKMIEAPMPRVGKDEVLVKVKYVGVCGSDINMLSGKMPIPEGSILGHEILGERVDTGEKVVINPLMYCGKCRPCRMGNVNVCSHSAFLGDGSVDGGFAEYISVKIDRLVNVDDLGIPDEKMVLSEPLSVGLHASRCATVTEGPVAVIGTGIIGQATIFALSKRGIKRIVAVDLNEARHPIALQMGATEVCTELTDDGYEAIYDCVGSLQTRASMPDKLLSCGTYVSVGALAREFSFRSVPVARFEKTVTGSFGCTDGELVEAIMRSGEIEDTSWCRVVPFEEGVEALNDLLAGKVPATQLKLVFKMQVIN